MIAAQSPAVCPMAEFLLRAQLTKQGLFKTRMWPENGSIPLPTAPGLGLALDESKIDKRMEV